MSALDTPMIDRCCSVVFTGSHAYGHVRPESDVDIVVLMTPEELADLRRTTPDMKPPFANDAGYDSPAIDATLRRGKLNFLLVTTQAQYDVWRVGTERCRALAAADPRGYIDRATAVGVFQELEQEMLT